MKRRRSFERETSGGLAVPPTSSPSSPSFCSCSFSSSSSSCSCSFISSSPSFCSCSFFSSPSFCSSSSSSSILPARSRTVASPREKRGSGSRCGSQSRRTAASPTATPASSSRSSSFPLSQSSDKQPTPPCSSPSALPSCSAAPSSFTRTRRRASWLCLSSSSMPCPRSAQCRSRRGSTLLF